MRLITLWSFTAWSMAIVVIVRASTLPITAKPLTASLPTISELEQEDPVPSAYSRDLVQPHVEHLAILQDDTSPAQPSSGDVQSPSATTNASESPKASKPARGMVKTRRQSSPLPSDDATSDQYTRMQTTHTDGSSAPSTGYHTLEKRHSFNGRGTYYQPDRGACGWVNSADDSIVAISVHQWDGGSHCGENIRVCHDGRCISVQVVDMCPSCHVGSLDFSPSAFSQLAPKSEGVIGIGWDYN